MRPFTAFRNSLRRGSLITITVGDETLEDVELDPTDASVSIIYGSNGTVTSVGNNASIAHPTWRSGGVSTDYEIRFTATSGTPSAGSSAFDTWLSLGSNQNVDVNRTTFGVKTCVVFVEIREAAAPFTVRDSGSVTLTATVDA